MQIKTRKLRLVFGLLATQIDEITVRSTEDGWNVRAVDPSHTSMIHAEIPAQAFVGYKQTGDFALSLKNVLKALANAGEETEITIADGVFVLESDGLRSKFPQITVAESDPKIPNIETTAKATVPVGEITRICPAVYGEIDAYRMTIDTGLFTISAEDESKNGATLVLDKEKCLHIDGQGRSMFAIDLLDRLLKALPKETVVDVSIGDDMPLMVDLQDADIRLRYLLAPRIEQE